jgi:hypothetical protein
MQWRLNLTRISLTGVHAFVSFATQCLSRAHSDAEGRPSGPTERQKKAANTKIKNQRLQLKQLLAQPLLAQGVSKRYITSGSNPIVHELLAGESESTALSDWTPNLCLIATFVAAARP